MVAEHTRQKQGGQLESYCNSPEETLEKCPYDRRCKKEVKIDFKDLGKDKFEKENHYFG